MSTELVTTVSIERSIRLVRGQKVLLVYGVSVKQLNQQVRRNIERFPEDLMFRLDAEEAANLRSQIVTSSSWGGRRYRPMAFTQQGIAMLSSVLRSSRAVQVNVGIMRAFVRLRRMLESNAERLLQEPRDCFGAPPPGRTKPPN